MRDSTLKSIAMSITQLVACQVYYEKQKKEVEAPAMTLTTSFTQGKDGYFGATVQMRYASVTFRYSPVAKKVMFFVTNTTGKILNGVTFKYVGATLKIYGWSNGKVTGSGITAFRKFNTFKDFFADKDSKPKNQNSEIVFFQLFCLQQLEAAAKPWVIQAPIAAKSNEKGMWYIKSSPDSVLLRMLYPCFTKHVNWFKTNQSIGYGKYSVDSPKQLAQNILGLSGKQAVNAVIAKTNEAIQTCDSEAHKFYPRLKDWSPEQIVLLFNKFGFNIHSKWLLLIAAIGSPQRCLDKLLVDGCEHTLLDCVNMLAHLSARKVKVEWLKELKTAHIFHNYLVYITNNIKTTDVKLWTNPEFTQFDGARVAGMKLVQPQVESTIKRWGAELGICVGSYESLINTGASTVFGLVDDQDRSQVCIEVVRNKDSYTIKQVFGYRNSGQSPELCRSIADLFKVDMKLTPFGQFDGFNYRPKEVVAYKVSYKQFTDKNVTVEMDATAIQTIKKNALYEVTRPDARRIIRVADGDFDGDIAF